MVQKVIFLSFILNFLYFSNGFECQQDGYFRHSLSCRKYIWCKDRTAKEFECSMENVFDEDAQMCTLPGVTDCIECPVLGSTIFPDDYDCEGYFSCNDGVLTKKTCKSGFNWDSKTKRCRRKAFAPCTPKEKTHFLEQYMVRDNIITGISERVPFKDSRPDPEFDCRKCTGGPYKSLEDIGCGGVKNIYGFAPRPECIEQNLILVNCLENLKCTKQNQTIQSVHQNKEFSQFEQKPYVPKFAKGWDQ